MIAMRMIKKTNGNAIIEDYIKTYGSIENLKNIIKRDPENVKTNYDLEEWEYYIKNPDEEVEDS
ncbi:MAG: hypothetical protein ACRC1M_06780, partial [Methanobacteriaceae archaeon]